MFKLSNFAVVNVISKNIAVKKYSSPNETHSHMCTFHELRTLSVAGDWFTKIFRIAWKLRENSVFWVKKMYDL